MSQESTGSEGRLTKVKAWQMACYFTNKFPADADLFVYHCTDGSITIRQVNTKLLPRSPAEVAYPFTPGDKKLLKEMRITVDATK